MGGLAGSVVISIGVALTERSWRTLLELKMWWAGLWFGAAVGLVTGPVGAWLLMRRAPLGVAIAWTTLGTVLGGVIGWFIHPILGAMIGFVFSALLVHRRYASTTARVSSLQGE